MRLFTPVVLAGGSGSRLWPLSRQGYPKQFIDLLDDGQSLFQATVARVLSVPGAGSPIVICSETNRFMVGDQLAQMGVQGRVLLEPQGRNTAPAIALAAHLALAEQCDEPMLIVASDHSIFPVESFVESAKAAIDVAKQGAIATFGVKPTRPETGYGYIHVKNATEDAQGVPVDKFEEKPTLETARAYLEEGNYFWNSGMFVVKPSLYLDQLAAHANDIYQDVTAAFENRTTDLDFIRVDRSLFERVRSESVDYAIMEHTDKVVLVPLAAHWTDVGSWDAVADILPKDEHDNAHQGDVILKDSQNCLVRAESRLVAAVGLKDLVIIETADAVLVLDKQDCQSVKSVVEWLKSNGRSESDHHQRVFRPWGWYESVIWCERFQTKRIMVKPGHSLSLQMHHHRAEHWIVVKGTAEVTRGDNVELYTEDQSTYIPLGTSHRLANPGLIPLEIIEVQTGSYLGEDDIVRYKDSYGRDG